MGTGSTAAAPAAATGNLGIALNIWRLELGLTVAELADLTPHDEHDLAATLTGDVPALAGHGPTMARALNAVMHNSRSFASA